MIFPNILRGPIGIGLLPIVQVWRPWDERHTFHEGLTSQQLGWESPVEGDVVLECCTVRWGPEVRGDLDADLHFVDCQCRSHDCPREQRDCKILIAASGYGSPAAGAAHLPLEFRFFSSFNPIAEHRVPFSVPWGALAGLVRAASRALGVRPARCGARLLGASCLMSRDRVEVVQS